MGTYEELKAAIQQVIRTNGNNEITGALLQNALLSIVNVVGANATFAGIATPDTNPGTADQNVFYLATEAGTYVNFGGIEINMGEAVILSNKTGNWVKTTSGFATQQQLTELESELERTYVRTGLALSGDITTNTEDYEVGIIHNGVVDSIYAEFRTYTVTNTQSGNRFIFIRAFHNGNIGETYSTVAIYENATNKLLFKSRLHGEQIVAIPSGTHAKFSQDSNFGVAFSIKTMKITDPYVPVSKFNESITEIEKNIESEYVRTGLALSGDITTNTEDYEVGIIHNGVVDSIYAEFRTYTVTNTQSGNRFIFIRAFHNGNIGETYSTVAIYENATNKLLFKSRLHGEQIVAIPSGTHAKFSQDSNFGVAFSIKTMKITFNAWRGKRIVWLGTSIPATGYPNDVAKILNVTCHNESVGSSMARRGQYNYADNDLGDKYGVTGVAWQNICYSLTLSQEEKHDIFINWTTENRQANLKNMGYSDSDIESIKGYSELMSGNFYGEETDESDITDPSSKPTDIMTDNYKDFRKKCYGRSYNNSNNIENGFGMIVGKLDKYLSWNNIPDLFVIDHGHNDNLSSDTNDEFINIPTSFHNRNTYVGAMNFLIQRILNFNPRQKILVISHYNRSSGYARILDAQKNLQKIWGISICDIADALQMDKDRIVTTNGYWDINKVWHESGYDGKNGYTGWRNTTVPENPRIENGIWVHDIPLLNAWMYDNLHPNTTDVKDCIAQQIARYIQYHL